MARQEVLVREAEILALDIQSNRKDEKKPYRTAYVFTEAGDRPKFFEVRLEDAEAFVMLEPIVRKKKVALVLDCFTWDKRESYTFLGLLSEFMRPAAAPDQQQKAS